ncbi:Uncharacterized conserved protein, DUF697 family [Seinonella peptonophila]|uniref:Uncharacterized conserved protein, DUF697 family n=1 Tax=Seinonella peptonophila TaxID=112248 RepID=A0A1M4ZNJ5_9BACL|nr:GTPase [Seinonella peptonophila]SHF19372.1 Uncharacterized conserved protein, DUF697 family [Seinonella peptonophila]
MISKRELKNRVDRVVDLYQNFDHLLNKLPIELPNGAKGKIKEIIFNNKEINKVINGLKERRPPRFIMIGRTGVGKSSLINAIFGQYVAITSPVKIGTTQHMSYSYESDGEVLFEVIDTRGIAESFTEEKIRTAEEDLKTAIKEFEPDAVLFLSNATERSKMDQDLSFIKNTCKDMGDHIPLVTILTHVDDLYPSRIKEAKEYSNEKIKNIGDSKKQMINLLNDFEINGSVVIPVSSYIEWDQENPQDLERSEREKLNIQFDGRYNIDELLDFLENNIDFNAAIHLMMITRIEKAIGKISALIIKSFASVSAVVAVTPVPFSDIFILLPIQFFLITIISYLSGADTDKDSVKDFLIGIGGAGILGYALRFVAQQGAKMINIVPGVGSTISAGIAYSGTYAIGKAAEAFYIDKKSFPELKNLMKRAKKEGEEIYHKKE